MSDLSLRRASGASFATIETAKRIADASVQSFAGQLNPALQAQFANLWKSVEVLVATNNALAARLDALEARHWRTRFRRWLDRALARTHDALARLRSTRAAPPETPTTPAP